MNSSAGLRPFQRPGGAVYGPVESRRFNRTLGVNVFPPGLKACSFNCVYCQLGRGADPAKREIPWPSAAGLIAEIDAAVAALKWHRRLGGDARKRNAFIAFIYKGA